jgi:AcrR family transcriptional regulator
MKEPVAPPIPDTRQRLLEGAARVFARDGIAGSTTRAIAREAGVNEVTLFRHFQTKERLIAAVIGENFGLGAVQARPPAPAPTADLRADLTEHGRRYEQLLKDNLPLIRTMIGEVQHHGDHERQVFKAIFRPLREALVARLETAQADSALLAEPEAEMLADLFVGMVFTGVLRRNTAHHKLEYSAANYLAAAVNLVVRGSGRRTDPP